MGKRMKTKMYRDPYSCAVDFYDGWDYDHDDGSVHNRVDEGTVVEVELGKDGIWREVE
jgi:hypothetical protein